MVACSVFSRRFEEPKWSLRIAQRSLKVCKFLLKPLLIAVSPTNIIKTVSPSKLLDGSSSQALEKTLIARQKLFSSYIMFFVLSELKLFLN